MYVLGMMYVHMPRVHMKDSISVNSKNERMHLPVYNKIIHPAYYNTALNSF